MREPEFSHATGVLQYRKWALENKKRADRLLDTVRKVLALNIEKVEFGELYFAAMDYEDQIG